MRDELVAYCQELEKDIKDAYEGGVTMEQAEKLAAKFLHAQMQVSARMTTLDLDVRMRKSGLKAIKAEVYLGNAVKGDKKPSDVLLNNLVDSDSTVTQHQAGFDQADVQLSEYQRIYDVFLNAHIYFRGLAKGN